MIKSENFVTKKGRKQLSEKSVFNRDQFPAEIVLNPQVCSHFFKQIIKPQNNHIISSNKGFAVTQIALKEKEVIRKSRSTY